MNKTLLDTKYCYIELDTLEIGFEFTICSSSYGHGGVRIRLLALVICFGM